MKESERALIHEYFLAFIARVLSLLFLDWLKPEEQYGLEGDLDYRSVTLPPSHQELLKKLIPYFPDTGTFLDVGCGSAELKLQISKLAPSLQYIGIDLSHSGLLLSKQQDPTTKLLQASAEAFPLSDHSVDVVYAKDLLPHIGHISIFLEELKRVMKPGGMCVLIFAETFYNHRGYFTVLPQRLKRKVQEMGQFIILSESTWEPSLQEMDRDWYKESLNKNRKSGVKRHVIILQSL